MSFDDNDDYSDSNEFSGFPTKQKAGRSCLSHLWGMFCSTTFLANGALFAFFLIGLQASRDLAFISGCIFLFAFLWQRRASRTGCLTPVFVFGFLIFWELVIVGGLFYQTGIYKQVDLNKVKSNLQRHAPEAYKYAEKFLENSAAQGKMLVDSAVGAVKNAVAEFTLPDATRKLIDLETAFRERPGDAGTVMALAEAYAARGDLASTRLSVALYEALVETEPSDVCLESLAEGYARLLRHDLAFSTALRRAWLPQASLGKVARQLAFLAVDGADLTRGIFELERLARRPDPEQEEIKLLLAALYKDAGYKENAMRLVDEILESAPETMAVNREAVALKKQLTEN